MAEFIPYDDTCCNMMVTPKRAILTLILLLNHDFKRDRLRQGFWVEYDDDPEECCPICNKLIKNETVVETSCLHRFHFDCILHKICCHDMKFCPDADCGLRIF